MQLYRAVSKALFKAHVQSKMKAEVMQDPLRFVNVDPAYTRTLLDQRAAGKKLALITNSDWIYTNTMMTATYEPYLPHGMAWADLFDVVVVSACKPEFFSTSRRPVYEIATADGFLREGFEFTPGSAYAGGRLRTPSLRAGLIDWKAVAALSHARPLDSRHHAQATRRTSSGALACRGQRRSTWATTSLLT